MTPAWRDKVPVLYVILRAQYFLLLFAACWSFVRSVLEFCLQRAGVLFAVCWSFVCRVRKFCLQRAGVFVCSVRELSLQRVILLVVVCMYFYKVSFLFAVSWRWFFDVLFMFARNFFYLQCFLFVNAVSPVGHRTYSRLTFLKKECHCGKCLKERCVCLRSKLSSSCSELWLWPWQIDDSCQTQPEIAHGNVMYVRVLCWIIQWNNISSYCWIAANCRAL